MNRFDLEEQIQSAWNTKDDIDILLESFLSEDMTKDEVANALSGISQLHEMRCKRVFDTFSRLISSGVISDAHLFSWEDYSKDYGRKT